LDTGALVEKPQFRLPIEYFWAFDRTLLSDLYALDKSMDASLHLFGAGVSEITQSTHPEMPTAMMMGICIATPLHPSVHNHQEIFSQMPFQR
jgi:hypothetical protein